VKTATQKTGRYRAVKRQGPPLKPAASDAERCGLSLRVTPKTKSALMKLAFGSGRTLSAIGEQLIEQSLRDRWLLNEIRKMNKSSGGAE
jgi:hypothetical protein